MDEGSELDVFWEILGGKTAIAPATSDEEGQSKSTKPCKLFVVSDASGQMTVDEVSCAPCSDPGSDPEPESGPKS